jgi:hypothetical protein
MRSTFSAAAVLVVVAIKPLAAQTVFVEGAAFVGVERLSHTTPQPSNASVADLSGTTVGGRVSVGTFVSPQWSVRVEVAVPNLLKSTTTLPPPILVPLPSPVVVVPAPIVFTQQIQRDYRAPSGAILVGYATTRRHHVAVSYLGGLMMLEERQHTVNQTSIGPVPGVSIPIPTQRTETTIFTYRAAAATGLDVDIAIAAHLALVPQIRADVFLGSLSVRPAAALRWNF